MRRSIPGWVIVWAVFGTGIAGVSAQGVRALWGFSADGIFSGAPEQTIAVLQELGCNAVFAENLSPELMPALRKAGIKMYSTVRVFGDHSAWKRYPQLRPINSHGQPVALKYGSGICPTQRWYWPRVLRRVSQQLDAGFDGVWLDFLRFSTHWEEPIPQLEMTCFCDSTLADFSRVTGIVWPPADSLVSDGAVDSLAMVDSIAYGIRHKAAIAAWILNNHRREWRSYKTGVITEFVAQAHATVDKKAGRTLGVFLVPWERSEFGFAILDHIGQDYTQLQQHADVLSPMLYHELCDRPVEWIAKFIEHTTTVASKPIWPIIQSDLGEGHHVGDDEFAAALLGAMDPPSSGVIVFRQQTLMEARQFRILGAAWK